MWLFGFTLVVIVCAAKCTEADVSVEAAFQEINSTSSDDNASNGEEDVLYQRGASFSAKLDISDLHISMQSFDNVDDDDDDDDDEAESGTGGKHSSAGQGRKARPPGANAPNSIEPGDELSRRKANHSSKQAKLPANEARRNRGGKASRAEKSIQNDGPSLVTAFGGVGARRHDIERQQQQQQQEKKKKASSGSERRMLNTTADGRVVAGANDDSGRRNMPPATNDMEISGISLLHPQRRQRAELAPETAVSSAAVARLAAAVDDDGDDADDDAPEIRALPLLAGSPEDDGERGERAGKLPPEVMGGSLGGAPHPVGNTGVDVFAPAEPQDNTTQHEPSGAALSKPCTLECGPEGTCFNGMEGSTASAMHCLCAFGKTGLRCEEDTKVNTPRFTKHSWVAFPALRGAYKHVQLHVEFRPESFDGILLLTGERDDLTGDFMALLLHQGFVEFWFDCGSGMGRVKSEETIVLNQWNTITIYRHRWDAWLVLNQGNRVQGRSKGLFSRITFREPVFLGGYGNITGLDRKLPVSIGFTGCIRKFVANDHDYNFQPAPLGDVSHGFDIQECITDRCSRYPCQHGGKCLPSDDGAICLCPLGFGGDLCEMRLDLQVPSFNGSSYLRYAPLGDSCIIWFELKIIIKPLLEDGLLLYSGHHEYGDYISLCLNMGYVEFTYDLGSGPATVRSEFPLNMGQWHTIKVSRTSRLAVLKIDQLPEVMTVSPNGFWHLSLPHSLYLGGVHNVHTLPMSLRDKGSFAGCIQKVDINDRTIAIISEALGGSNVENCPHACVARPCGPLAKCVPNLDTYECQCNPQNRQCNQAEELPSEVIEKQQRLLRQRKQQEQQRTPAPPATTPRGGIPSTTTSTTTLGPPEDSTLPHDNSPADGTDGGSEESDEAYDDYYQDDDDCGEYHYDSADGHDYGASSGDARDQRWAALDVSAPPPASVANEADKQSSSIGSTTTNPATTTVANEKIIVWIDRQKSKDSFSTESTDYVDYAYGGDLADGATHTVEGKKQSDSELMADERGKVDRSEGVEVVDDLMRDGTARENHTPRLESGDVGELHSSELGGFGEARKHDTVAPGDEAYDGADGMGKDYDQHGDRIPYRPEYLLRQGDQRWKEPTVAAAPRRAGRRGQTGRTEARDGPEIDETLIEEMNRIMKNHNDDSADAADDNGFWGVLSDGESPFADETDVDGDERVFDGSRSSDDADSHHGPSHHYHHHHHHHHQHGPQQEEQQERGRTHHRRRNDELEEMDSQDEGKDAQQQQQQQKEHQQQQEDQQQSPDGPRNDEDDVLRSMKYKNKYFRKYQGACFTGTDSYFHYSDAETMRRVISYEIDLNLRFKTHSTNGLILWTGRHSALEADDFLSLGIENGYLHLRYNLGSGEINIKYNATKVSDGLWHRVRALRNSQDGTLKVDGGKPITRRSPGKLRQLNTDTGLYVGGLPAAPHYTRQRYRTGMAGCISELILAGELRLNFDATILGTAHNVEPGAP
uniref:Pikachurin n=1 Tax=Anopheles atroparvus TaxID=41427 RepID=A0AAG5D5E4_ANOAO